ncbi:MAG: Gfo/Idh/MocA family protein [Halothermotrichaceae bacterium]
MRKKTVAVIGAGNRGREVYGDLLKQEKKIKINAVAEPDEKRRNLFVEEHNIPDVHIFNSWQQLLKGKRISDALIIATLDNMHLQPVLKAIEKGYKILLEKPIAPDLNDTLSIINKAREYDSDILIAHVLRYTNFYKKLKDIIDSNVIGQIRLVNHIENIGFYHFAHSYVRGNWRNTDTAAPIILAKSCHDMDILYWLLEKKCIKLSSHASLKHFTESQHPAGAGDRCVNCAVEKSCPYSAVKIYINDNSGWPISVITTDLSYTGRKKALKQGSYGRCVYKCDNNVPDTQTVRMTFADNIEVNFALTAFSKDITRTTRVFGSRGEIDADFDKGIINIHSFNGDREQIKIQSEANGRHGGGDAKLIEQFSKFIFGEPLDNSLTTIEDSLESHIMAFAAEDSRKNDSVVYLDKYRVTD